MPKLVIKSTIQKNQVFWLKPGTYPVGRNEAATLILPDVSVSREHCRFVVAANGEATIEDMGGANGTIVNGQKTKGQVLRPRDELLIGRFTMVYLGDEATDRFYNGRYVAHMPIFDPAATMLPPVEGASTMSLTDDAVRLIQKGNLLQENARVILTAKPEAFWYPEEQGLTFGGGAMIPVSGWFVGGVAAELSWDGKQHVLVKKGFLSSVSVNGSGIQRRPLRSGDRFKVGGTEFTYDGGEA